MASDSPDSPPSPPPSGSPEKRRKISYSEIVHMADQSEDGCEPLRQRAPMEEDESGSLVCGICFSEGGKSISGHIDSCDHYFCFVCILEWAKVESRCPMCKQRFTSIHRPPKLGVFASERIVRVPERDQIYHLSGNATTTRSDPYAETRCLVCLNMADESLLLLCDLCDSAAHTYCVGLGHTVPESDWFCHDCAVSRAEHENADQGDQNVDSESEHVAGEYVEPAAADPNISIYDIVKDTSRANRFSGFVSPGRRNSIADEGNSGVPETHKNPGGCWAVESSARTLRRCRNVQSRIQVLRDNWNSFRNGSLKFPSGSGESSAGNRKRREEGSVSLSSSTNELATAPNGHTGFNEGEKKDPYDTEKAWKMLEMAKRAQKIRTGHGNHLSKAQGSSSDKLLSKIRPCNNLPEKQQTAVRNPGSSVMRMKQKQILHYPETDRESLKQKHILDPTHLAVQRKPELPSSSVVFHGCPSYRKDPVGSGTDSSVTRSCKSTIDKSHPENRTTRSLNTAGHVGDFVRPQKRTDVALASSSKQSTGKCLAVKVEKTNEDAKTEIQSLVKLKMKLLSKDKPLGVGAFKEVARISTHTILAGCGLEHSKVRALRFKRPICNNHGDETQQKKKKQSSSLMRDVCRECFNAFATDVVRSVLRDKSSLL